MRKQLFNIVLALVGILLVGCKDDSSSAGGSVLEKEDKIVVKADTFSLRSDLKSCDSIVSMPDSFMLGEMVNRYGTLRADILTQFACPIGFQYPETATVDSVCLCLCYRSWFGDGNTPMGIEVYQMSKGSFDYATSYPTNIRIEDYVDTKAKALLAHEKVVVASKHVDSVYAPAVAKYHPMIRARMSDEFTQKFFQIRDFSSQEAFNKLFQGLYITNEFGSATILNIIDVNLSVHYSFKYTKAGKDTIVHDTKAFYANSEVRQINRVSYLDKKDVLQELVADSATYNYVVSPAHIYTRLQFPMKSMQDTIISRITTEKRPYVNMARVKVEVCNVAKKVESRNDWAQPAPKMLLIKENAMKRFFTTRELPSDTCALLGELTKGTNKEGKTEYYYTYDLSTLLTNQLRHTDNPDTLSMLLVPVDVAVTKNNSKTYITSIKQQQTVSATQTYSANNALKPMTMEVVYSGF